MNTQIFKKDILPLQDKMYRYALSIVFDTEVAKDIIQEVFLKIWTKRDQLTSIKHKEAWCIRITRNLSLDKLKAANRRNVSLEFVSNETTNDLSPSDEMETNDLLSAIHEAMKDLNNQQKEIFRLRDLMGYSNKEIKEILDLNDNQIKVNLYRARQRIKLKLGKLINYGG